SQVNGSNAVSGVPNLSEEIPLVPSTFSLTSETGIGYELNGLSDTGDWYQLVVAYDWPSCGVGFQIATEIWDNGGNSAPIDCPGSISLSKGDLVRLAMRVSSTKQVCMTLTDLRTSSSDPICVSQP